MKENKYGIKWILAHTKNCRFQMIAYTFLVLCIPIIQLLFAYFMKMFIDIAVGDDDNSLLNAALYSIIAIIACGAAMMTNSVLAKFIYGTTEREIRTKLMGVILTRKMLDVSKQHSGELMTKLTADTQAASSCYMNIAENIIGGLASALLATSALFFLNWKIAIMLVVLTPLMMFLMGKLSPQVQKISTLDKSNDEINRTLMQESLNRIALLKAYSMQNKVVEKVGITYKEKLKSGIRLGLWEGLAAFLGVLSGNIMSLVALGLGSYFVLKGETTVGSLIMIVQLLNYIVTPIAKFPAAVAQIGQATASATRIGSIYEMSEECVNTSAPANASELVAENICFSYSAEEKVLTGIDLSFHKGEVTGIVGKSGSGKSTILKLLMGLYLPTEGSVKLKCGVETLSGENIIPQVAYVPPEDYLFSGTIAENITMSDSNRDNDKMSLAAANANILNYIQSLENGFDTVLGEGGNTVSSGQAQRIAIARAIYKNSGVFIFDEPDEPTANLDQESIDVFQKTVKALAHDNICIIVTHDTSTAEICDKIYTLENGKVSIKL
ncbi:MAG: ABC transporter ATP-binding protein/permease [Lachnospiraceae bacterium]|nr:ABC transporter ATP-binding protein/permease [Ruminococcus sp.]MCM1276881.1 ABC transporter ATP-binding protein/permease [Lachnospiraceae bacterium]